MIKLSIRGQIISQKERRPLSGYRIQARPHDASGKTRPLGEAVSDAAGRFRIDLEDPPKKLGEVGFWVFVGDQEVREASGLATWSPKRPNRPVVLALPAEAVRVGDSLRGVFEVSGRITDERGIAVAGARVTAADLGLRGETVLGHAVTDEKGRYTLAYDPAKLDDKALPDLVIQVSGAAPDGATLQRSAVRYRAASREIFDLRVSSKDVKKPAEHERLLDAIAPHLGESDLGALSAAEVTHVANKSGWDARAVAMASEAAKLSTETGFPAAHYYALFRTGVAGRPSGVESLSTGALERALRAAGEKGIIGEDDPIDASVKKHREIAGGKLRELRTRSGVSSLGEMLSLSLGDADQNRFLGVFLEHGDSPEALWPALAEEGFDEATVARLQTHAKLGSMSLQNRPLVARIVERPEFNEPADLVRMGLYEAAAWEELIGNDTPEGIAKDAYARGLAAQVSLSYPSLVTSEVVRRGQLPFDSDALRDEVAQFFAPGDRGKSIGADPVKRWDGYAQLTPEAQSAARSLERTYQMSPSNESMIALSRNGLDSAFRVMHYSNSGFIDAFGEQFPTMAEARLVYDKAQEIHATALNVATTYLTQRASPNVYAITGRRQRAQEPVPEDVPGAATLEELFTNLDYCACDHCKSVLSPAAYMVDLLQFIDLTGVPHEKSNPIDVLFVRRPDVKHLLLSCENTNVALPYVDIVNEILEHYITNGNLDSFVGFNMREDSSSADLLADPEFVTETAYVETKSKVYPWNLPFDMPLEAIRLLLHHLDIELADAWGVFRSAGDARREAVGLSADERSILTDANFRSLPEYFGEPAAATIDQLNDAVADAKTFSRRAAISHQDLVSLLKTRFINPGSELTPLLRLLPLSLATIQSWFDGATSDADLLAALPADFDLAPFGGDLLQWLTDRRELIMRLITLTDVSPDAVGCDFALVELRLALPDMAANRLSALEYHKLLRFIRLWKKLGWSIEETDELVRAFLSPAAENLTLANLDAAFVALLDRIGNFLRLASRLSLSAKKRADWLKLWSANESPALRRERLGRLLRFGITDLERLIELSGVDPLADDITADEPSILAFVDFHGRLKALGLKVTDLNYLLRNSDDAGALTPDDDALLRDLKSLRDGLTAVDTQLRASPESLDLSYVQAKMALVYDTAVVEWFFGLVDHASTYSAPLVMAEEVLPENLSAAAAVGYDPFAKQLTFTGLMPAATQAALNAAADALTLADVDQITDQPTLDGLIADFKTAVQALFDAGAADLQTLADEYPELKAVYDTAAALQDPEAQATAILDAILPELRRRLKETSLRTGLGKLLGVDADSLEAMLTVTPANGNAAQPVLGDFLALENPVAFDADGAHAFYLDPPSQDDYILYVQAPENTTVALTLDGGAAIPATAVGPSGELSSSVALPLDVGAPLAAELTLTNLPGGQSVRLLWRARGIAKQLTPGARLYGGAEVAEAWASLLRLQKVSMLGELLRLTPAELTYFAVDNPAVTGFVGELPVEGVLAGAALQSLWDKFAWLMWFADWRRADEPEEDVFVGLLRQPDALTPQGAPQLARANDWLPGILEAVLTAFGLTLADISNLANLRRVVAAMRLLGDSLYPAADMAAWASAEPDLALFTSAKQSLRERLDDKPCRDLLKDVNDKLRNRRLEALVSYIIHHQSPGPGIDTPNRLYEHFLVDVQMDACRQTSRIRQALSSIQLFITRCLMNLEEDVASSSIREDHWQWMKRYRVWEANRKVFLYPENWLEPELRDGKSPFFRELESELLKSDLTQELAEDAYFKYLKKLDEVARLEIVGCYLEEQTPGNQDDDILHVVGRTNGNTREHYYRRFEYGYWTPWEKVPLNIEGDQVVLVVWKSRPFLFWITFLEKGDAGGKNKTPEDLGGEAWGNSAKKNVEISLGWGEYYKGKWTSPKSTEMASPLRLHGLTEFYPELLQISVRTETPPGRSERLHVAVIHFGSGDAFVLTFTSKNSPPIVSKGFDDTLHDDVELFNYQYFSGFALVPWYGIPITIPSHNRISVGNQLVTSVAQPPLSDEAFRGQMLLTKKDPSHDNIWVRPFWQKNENQWEAPFFFWDEIGVFHVTAEETRTYDLKRPNPGFFTIGPEVNVDLIPVLQEIPEIPRDPVGPWITPSGNLIPLPSGEVRVVLGGNAPFEFDGVPIGANGVIAGFVGRS